MTPEEKAFDEELDIFRREVESGLQFFYGWLAINGVAGKDKAVERALNESSLFWLTVLGALQSSTFITLGRLFDQQSPHNVDTILGMAQRKSTMFSKAALGERKKASSANWREWLGDYLRDAYEPTPVDFRRLRAHVKKWRAVYNAKYRDIRRKIHAHKEIVDRTQVQALYANTRIREVEHMLVFLKKLQLALWELFHNGNKPVLKPMPYAASRMLAGKRTSTRSMEHVHRRIIEQAQEALQALTSAVEARNAGESPRKRRASR